MEVDTMGHSVFDDSNLPLLPGDERDVQEDHLAEPC